jgi:hypothetical protein
LRKIAAIFLHNTENICANPPVRDGAESEQQCNWCILRPGLHILTALFDKNGRTTSFLYTIFLGKKYYFCKLAQIFFFACSKIK